MKTMIIGDDARQRESRVCACTAGVRRLLSQLLFTSIQTIIIKDS